ncbi:hypothetical protein G5I_11691 [Acromyrmex echinatior]|uniref:Transposase n=1 Tax=Acromyrmex echinatior TaxID=103372 RepID=F4X084_ACREC|nr:hypothetical protein G5I_11691 [Acromyrmex echinatior]
MAIERKWIKRPAGAYLDNARLALEKRAPVYETSPRTVGNRLEKWLAGPHERIFVPFKPDKNRRGREGNANGTYEFVGLQEVQLGISEERE